MQKRDLFEFVDECADQLTDVALDVWNHPELGLEEYESSKRIRTELEDAGFDVETDITEMPTAFVASYGTERPTVGILGEFDALPDLSQEVIAERSPVTTGAPGHGCGHNLYGAGSLGAALAIKEAIDSGELSGGVRYYGCPAEEFLVGKVYMAHHGAFDDLDAVLAWHPYHLSFVRQASRSLAMDSIYFEFEGISAHAAASPEAGRSALDAVQLMNTGAEYLREHVPDAVRVHYSIVEGGKQPNVVPATAGVWYYVRAPSRDSVEAITERIRGVAEGAALMTDTGVEETYITGTYNYLFNDVLSQVMNENLQDVGAMAYDPADEELASQIRDSISDETIASQLDPVPDDVRERIQDESLFSEPLEPMGLVAGSADTGNVSWITPLAMCRIACWPVGTPPHTWQAVVANGSFGTNGIKHAAKVLAATAYDLLSNDTLLKRAKAELEKTTGSEQYRTPLSADAAPPVDVIEQVNPSK